MDGHTLRELLKHVRNEAKSRSRLTQQTVRRARLAAVCFIFSFFLLNP